jgi:hypothetical protein
MASENFTAKQTTVKAAWCNDLDNFFYTIFGGATTETQVFYLTGGQCNVGDYGLEESGVNVNSVVYDTKLRVNDIGGENPAQLVLHRHSTTWPSVILGSLSNSDDSSHADVTNGQSLFILYGSGWTGSHYDLFGAIDFQADSTGTVSATSSPGAIVLSTTADGSNAPTAALTIDSSQNITLNHSTEDLKFVDSGSASSTEQDWIEVTVGGNTGYIRVYAAK